MEKATKEHLYEIIFEADTPGGKLFDVGLLVLIFASVAVVMLDSVESIRGDYGEAFQVLEWIFTALFTLEYLLRLLCVRRPVRYALSFFGVVDLLAILPTYAGLFMTGVDSLVVIRALRLLRVFRVFKLVRFLGEANVLSNAIRSSIPKLIVFLVTVLIIVTIIGTSMHIVEGGDNPGFASIPESVYWAIVTVTTVGFGDAVPMSVLGKFLASVLMVTGFAILAVPTGIMTAEIMHHHKEVSTQVCPHCLLEGHDPDAGFCKACGTRL